MARLVHHPSCASILDAYQGTRNPTACTCEAGAEAARNAAIINAKKRYLLGGQKNDQESLGNGNFHTRRVGSGYDFDNHDE